MSDPLAHVGPSEHYLRGYNDGVAGRELSNPYPLWWIAASEYEEGFWDGHADVAEGVVLGGAVTSRH